MKIKASDRPQYVFSDLKPGEVFMYGQNCMMKVLSIDDYNAMDLSNGAMHGITQDEAVDFKDQAVVLTDGETK